VEFKSADDLVYMFKHAYPRDKYQPSISVVYFALAENGISILTRLSYILKVARYSSHIVRCWVINLKYPPSCKIDKHRSGCQIDKCTRPSYCKIAPILKNVSIDLKLMRLGLN